MNAHGTVHKYGDHVDTDVIIPARYLNTQSHKELAAHCMEDIDKEFIHKVKDGDIMVAGVNFGCGSSREHAPIAILGAGMPVVIGHSFARIFYRNAFNQGLLLFEIGDGVDKIKDGDQVEIDSDRGIITDKTNGSTFTCPPLSKTISAIVEKGGLVNYVKSRLLAQAK